MLRHHVPVEGPRHHYARRVVLLVIVAAAVVFPAPTASATTDFTWTGTATGPDWSSAANWGGAAPSGSVGVLNFPELSSSGCTTDTCYSGSDDVSGLIANEISIDDTAGYDLAGDQPLTLLGPEGFSVIGDDYPPHPSSIAIPIDLGGPQTWSIDGADILSKSLDLQDGVEGAADAVQIGIGGGSNLRFGGDSETGPVTVTGDLSYDDADYAAENGTISLDSSSASLNADDGNSVDLVDAEIMGPGSTGPLTSAGGAIFVPSGILQVGGSVSLDDDSLLNVGVNSAGTTPGASYAQLSATGNINLGGSELSLSGACAGLVPGQSLTIVTTTATLSGTFSGTPNGTIVTANCGDPVPTFEIQYTAHSVTATVITPGPSVTSTTVSVDPSSAETDQELTLTATVTADSGTPWGTVTFTSTPSWVHTLAYGALCGANFPLQAVSGASTMTTASCSIPFPAAGSPFTIEAIYTPGGPPQAPSADVTTAPSTGTTSLSVTKAPTTTLVTQEVGLTTTQEAYVSPDLNAEYVPVSGTVAFFNHGSPITECSAVTISQADFHGDGSAACPGVNPIASDVTATYSGDANYLASSSPPGPGPLTPPEIYVSQTVLPATLLLTSLHAAANAVTVEVGCTLHGAVACGSVEAVLAVRETTDGAKIIAVAASSKRHSRTQTRTVQVGYGTALLNAAAPTRVTVELGPAGRELLAKRHRFTADLAFESIGDWSATTATTTVTVTAPKASKHHTKRQR